jgi:hypothetical protein
MKAKPLFSFFSGPNSFTQCHHFLVEIDIFEQDFESVGDSEVYCVAETRTAENRPPNKGTKLTDARDFVRSVVCNNGHD